VGAIKTIVMYALWIIPLLAGIVIAYTIIRLVSYGLFKSYFQAKEEHNVKEKNEEETSYPN